MKRFKNILFARSVVHNEAASRRALALAKHNDAALTFLETPEEIPDLSAFGLPNDAINQMKEQALAASHEDLEKLAELKDQNVGEEKIEVEFRVVEGIRFLTIIREVLRQNHDLVIKSTEGEVSLVSRLFSTTDMHLLRKCPSPIWLIKPDCSTSLKQIVAAVDFDQPGETGENETLNKQIMEMAVSLAYVEGAKLHIVHAWQPIGEPVLRSGRAGMPMREVEEYIEDIGGFRRRRLAELMEQVRDWVGRDIYEAVKPVTHAIKGRAQEVIVKQTKDLDADLLVMGTVGRVGIPGFFIGNTAESILNGIDCSVLAVKPAGFVSPVTL